MYMPSYRENVRTFLAIQTHSFTTTTQFELEQESVYVRQVY